MRMRENPVAWMTNDDPPRVASDWSRNGMFATAKESYCIPLYSQSPAEVRALAIAEAAQACIDYANGIKEMSSRDASVAFECADIIGYKSPAPSVSEEWIEARLNEAYAEIGEGSPAKAVRATLTALGIAVEGATK